MHEKPSVTPVESHESDPKADQAFAGLLQNYENRVPESVSQAESIAQEIRDRAAGVAVHTDGTATVDGVSVNKSLAEELQDKASAGLGAWRLSDEDRLEWKNTASVKSWADLTPPMQNYMKSLKKDVYQPMGMVFADLQSQAEKRLKLDDEIKAREMEAVEQKAATEAKEAAEQKIRDNYAKSHADFRADIDATKADKEKQAFQLRMKYGGATRPDVVAALEAKTGSAQEASAPVEKRVIDPNVNKEKAHANSNATSEALRKFYRKQLVGEPAEPAAAGKAPSIAPDTKTGESASPSAPEVKVTRQLEAHGQFTNQDYMQFNDGETGLSFSEPGTQIVLGADSIHKYARYFDENGGNMALVYTEGDGKYGLARGKVIDMRTGEATSLPDGSLGFTIGDKFTLPGSNEATTIQEVLLRHKIAAVPLQGAEHVDGPSPFKALDKLLKDDRAKSAKVMPVVAAAQQPVAPQAPAPEKRTKRRMLAAAAVAGALTVAALFGMSAQNNGGDVPHREVAAVSLDLEGDKPDRSDKNVEEGKTVSVTVEAGNGPTQEMKELAKERGIKATPQQLYDTYKKFADKGSFDNIDGMYRMNNGDYGFASAGAHELPADLVNDMLEDLKKSAK